MTADIPLLDPDGGAEPTLVGHLYACHRLGCGKRVVVPTTGMGEALQAILRRAGWTLVAVRNAKVSLDGSTPVPFKKRCVVAYCNQHGQLGDQQVPPSLEVAHRCGGHAGRCANLLLRTEAGLAALQNPRRRCWMGAAVPIEGVGAAVEPLCPHCARELLRAMRAAAQQHRPAEDVAEALERLL